MKQDPDTIDEVILIGGSTRIPRVQEILQQNFGRNLALGANIDEDVAKGASIQATVLLGLPKAPRITLADVIPLSLGIEATNFENNDVFSAIMDRNHEIPGRKSRTFLRENGTVSMRISVYEGSSENCKKNFLIHEFRLRDLDKFDGNEFVEFVVDMNGVLSVMVKDAKTNKTITNEMQLGGYKLSDTEISEKIEMITRLMTPDDA